MKQYIYKVLGISLCFFFVVFLFACVRVYYADKIDWTLPKEKHILFLGASHPYHGINDSLLVSAKNISHPSERYMYTYLKLQKLLESNSQVDTIFLECSSTDLWQDTDYKYYDSNEQSYYIPTYWPMFGADEWGVVLRKPKTVISLFGTTLLKRDFFNPQVYFESFGGKPTVEERNKIIDLKNVHRSWALDKVDTEYGNYGYEINYKYLRKIVDLCKLKGVKLYLVGYPLYNESLTYDHYFCTRMRKKYFNDVEFLDYVNWKVPNSCRMDAHHLNGKGAILFTNELKNRFRLR